MSADHALRRIADQAQERATEKVAMHIPGAVALDQGQMRITAPGLAETEFGTRARSGTAAVRQILEVLRSMFR